MADYGGTLFKGTSWYYSRYRPLYPSDLIRFLVQKFSLSGQGKLLDVGCGTGQLALRFADWFSEIVGVDSESEMIEEATRISRERRILSTTWVKADASEISRLWTVDSFRLVLIAKAFHWFHREKVLENLYPLVSKTGGIAIIDNYHPESAPAAWQTAVNEVVKKWLGESRRAGATTYVQPSESYEEIVDRSRFDVESHKLPIYDYVWTVETIIGDLYSKSFSSRRLLGNNAQKFENDLKESLYRLNSSGTFIEPMGIKVILGIKH